MKAGVSGAHSWQPNDAGTGSACRCWQCCQWTPPRATQLHPICFQCRSNQYMPPPCCMKREHHITSTYCCNINHYTK
eukprot:3410893-Amphidinium_carterae.1